jgi:hypothetical protein
MCFCMLFVSVYISCVQTGCLALVPGVTCFGAYTTLPNEIRHSAQERALLLEVVLNNGTVLNMFWEPV